MASAAHNGKKRATLDGEPAEVVVPKKGMATISTETGRRLMLDTDKTYAVLKAGGQFQSPKFARPAHLR